MTADEALWPILPREALVDAISVAVTRDSGLGLILTGESGIGKTTIVQQFVARMKGESSAPDPVQLRGNELSRSIPFGLLYGLLHSSDSAVFGSSADVFRALLALIPPRGDGRRVPVIVDNASLVDEASAHALVQAASVGSISIVVVDQDLSELPEAFLELWRDGLLESVVVPALTAGEISAVLSDCLGGPVVPPALRALAATSHGNPLHLKYLVLEQIAASSLVLREGVWVLASRITLTNEKLLGLLRTRLERWTPEQLEVLEFVALTEGMPFTSLEQLVSGDAIEELLADGAIDVVAGQEPLVQIRHRLIADVIRASVPFVRRRQLRNRVSPHYLSLLAGSPESVLAFSLWTLECGVPLEPAIAVRAAALANRLYDPEFALRVASTVTEAEFALGAALEKSRAWRILGVHRNAAQTLARLDENQRAGFTASQLVELAIELSRIAVLLPAEEEQAVQAVAEAERALAAAPAIESLRHSLDVAGWDLAIAHGDYLAVAAPLEAAFATARPDEANYWVGVASLLAETLCTLGRQDDALAIITDVDLHLQNSGLDDDVRDRAYAAVFITLLKLGLWTRNIGILTTGAGVRFGQELYRGGASDSALGVNYLFGGRASDGHSHLLSALGQVRVRDAYNSRGQILSALAYSAALADDAEIAKGYLDELGDGLHSYGHSVSVANYLALNALAVVGDGGVAAERMIQLAAEYRSRGLLMDDLLLLSSAGRVGSFVAIDELQHRRLPQPGPLALCIYQWATAVKADDLDALVEAAEALQHLGNDLFAREAATVVASRARGDLLTRATAVLRNASLALRDGTGGELHLRGIDSLTKRERDVTALAARGMTNKEIADSFFLSVRTVESYLQSAFGKLGIGGRTELAAALG